MIWNEVMWYAYIDLSEIKIVEYHVGEGSSEEEEHAKKRCNDDKQAYMSDSLGR